jgi:hypothetical protein
MEHAHYKRGALERLPRPPLQYEFVLRRAGQLACGDVAREPALGLARVSTVTRTPPPFVRIEWTDDYGPSTAAGRYHADQQFAVRVPGPIDQLRIQRGLDRATWLSRQISRDTARLIAAHLHRGPSSALYCFVAEGRITEDFFDELDQIHEGRRFPEPWVQALAHYVVSREALGPLSRWESTASPVPDTDQTRDKTAAPQTGTGRRSAAQRPLVLVRKQIAADHALQLIDAAYALGFAAGRAEGIAAAVRRPAWARWVAGVER